MRERTYPQIYRQDGNLDQRNDALVHHDCCKAHLARSVQRADTVVNPERTLIPETAWSIVTVGVWAPKPNSLILVTN